MRKTINTKFIKDHAGDWIALNRIESIGIVGPGYESRKYAIYILTNNETSYIGQDGELKPKEFESHEIAQNYLDNLMAELD